MSDPVQLAIVGVISSILTLITGKLLNGWLERLKRSGDLKRKTTLSDREQLERFIDRQRDDNKSLSAELDKSQAELLTCREGAADLKARYSTTQQENVILKSRVAQYERRYRDLKRRKGTG